MLKIDNSNLSSIQFCQLKVWSRGGWQNRELTVVKLLLTNGADVLARNNHDTVLHQVVSSDNKVP